MSASLGDRVDVVGHDGGLPFAGTPQSAADGSNATPTNH